MQLKSIMATGPPDDILEQAGRLAREVRGILLAAQASFSETSAAGDVFEDFYFFVVEYVGKVLAACERVDVMAARSAAFHLQEEICQLMHKVERGFYGTDFNLLGEYAGAYEKAGFPGLLESASRGDLPALARQARQLDAKVREWFERHSIALNILADEEHLRRFLNQRDPVSLIIN